jgi:ribosome biogenesis GTPase
MVDTDDGDQLRCFSRGKKNDVACGDRVRLSLTGHRQGVIDLILPRHTLLYRSDAFREKSIAANVTQLIMVVAAEPEFSDEVLARGLVAAESADIAPLIVLNKCDLGAAAARARSQLSPWAALDYPILELSAKQDVTPLRERLHGHTSVLVGQSGMGKSTLINALLPGTGARTQEISLALGSGKHTTTHAELYRLDPTSAIIDSPGLQEFGLAHLSHNDVAAAFRDIAPLLGECRFRDCRHRSEPGCAVQKAVATGQLSDLRYQLFLRIAGTALARDER